MRFTFHSILAVLLASALALEAQSTITIAGKVLDDATKKGISNALVSIEEADQYTYTNQRGEFEISVPKGGRNRIIRVSRVGYEATYRKVDIESETTIYITFELPPQPFAIEEILVTAASEHAVMQTDVLESKLREVAPKDIGEFFKNVPGFGAIRKGGFGMDPVLRNFKDEQLNVQFDGGIHISHACPNRMDPATAHVQAEDLEKIEVIKGPFSVRFGPSVGGVINLITKRPPQTDRLQFHGELESGYDSNGSGKRSRLALTASGPFYDFYLGGGVKDFGNYENGDDLEIPSAFQVSDYSLKGGVSLRHNQRLQLSWRQSFARDIFYPGLPMDSEKDDTEIWALDYKVRNPHPRIPAISAKIYGTWVDHVMANYQRPNYQMVHAVANVTSQTMGGRIEVEANPRPRSFWYAGADFYLLQKDGSRQRQVFKNGCTGMVMDPPKSFEDGIWQDSGMTDAGLFSEWRQFVGERLTLVAGGRLDFISANIDEPAKQFLQEYGQVGSQDDLNLSATMSLNYRLQSDLTFQLAAGRGVRSPNLKERYINHLSVGQDPYEYVGNPNLAPEVNHQLELSVDRQGDRLNLRGSLFYSSVNDYIVAAVDTTLPRLFLPCKDPQHAKRFQNIEQATQMGAELFWQGDLWKNLNYRGSLTYTRGNNEEWDEPLPEVPPLEARWALRYTDRTRRIWSEINGRLAAEQKRISESFGEAETPGFWTVDLRTNFEPWPSVELTLGVQNLFDQNYHEHLNRGYRNMPVSEILYEPGRNIFLQTKLRY